MARRESLSNGEAAPPKPLTPKQEAFCLAYHETGNASEAYRQSYSAAKMKEPTVHRAAHELLSNPKITTRLDELKAEAAERNEVTVDSLTDMLEEAFNLAKAEKTASAMVSAVMGLGKLHGHIVEKKKVDSNNRHHHTAGSVSPFDEFLRRASGRTSEEPSKESLPN